MQRRLGLVWGFHPASTTQAAALLLDPGMNPTASESKIDLADYSGIPAVVLESLRVRLAQLVHSLNGLHAGVTSRQLPPWPALHQQFNIALLQLESVVSNLESVPDATQGAVVYPMPSFPSRSFGGLLTTLLRKKSLPEIEEWITDGNEMLASEGLDLEADDEFCQWAWETTEAVTQITVKPLSFKAPATAGGWPIDKVIAFMAGQDVENK